MRRFLCLAVMLMLGLLSNNAFAEEYFDRYPISVEAKQIDLGVQPMAYPLAFISSVMQRDLRLRAELKAGGYSLSTFPYRKGNDMVALMGDGKLEGAMLGDMPTINSAVRTPIAIVGLGKRNFSSVVSRGYSRIEQLRGKKMGYSPGSSSHFVLLRGLEGAGLRPEQVTLVKLEPTAMPEALERGDVDAFSAWEPTPSISLATNPKNKAIFRGMSTDWFALSQDFVDQHPDAAMSLVAAYARSIAWMRQSSANVRKAAAWVLADGEAFLGSPPKVSLDQAVRIVRKDLLDVAGAPAVPKMIDDAPPLSREFAFLRAQDLLIPGAEEVSLTRAFKFDGLKTVLSAPEKYKLYHYDYEK